MTSEIFKVKKTLLVTFLNLRNSKVLVFPRVECSNLKTFRQKRLHFEEKHINGLDTLWKSQQSL